jgi:hypothetical protein
MHQSNSASGLRPFGTTPKAPVNRPDLNPHAQQSKLEATSVRRVRIVLTIASATTTGTLALLGVASPAQADPMIPLSPDPTQCRQFGFPGHPIKLESPKNHENLEFNGSGPDVATTAVLRNQGGQDSGSIRGSIKGRNVYLSVDFDHIGSRVWTGTVDNRGGANGVTSDGKQWFADFTFPCIDELVPKPG